MARDGELIRFKRKFIRVRRKRNLFEKGGGVLCEGWKEKYRCVVDPRGEFSVFLLYFSCFIGRIFVDIVVERFPRMITDGKSGMVC